MSKSKVKKANVSEQVEQPEQAVTVTSLLASMAHAGQTTRNTARIPGVRLSVRRAGGKESTRLQHVLTIGHRHAQAAGLEAGQRIDVQIHGAPGECSALVISRTDNGAGLRLRGVRNPQTAVQLWDESPLPLRKPGERLDLRVEQAADGKITCVKG